MDTAWRCVNLYLPRSARPFGSSCTPWRPQTAPGLQPGVACCFSTRWLRGCGFRAGSRLARLIKTSEPAAVRALSAAVREAGRARFPLLKRQPPGPFADVTDSRSPCSESTSDMFRSFDSPPFVISGSRDNNTNFDSPAAAWRSRSGSAGTAHLPAGKRAGESWCARARRPESMKSENVVPRCRIAACRTFRTACASRDTSSRGQGAASAARVNARVEQHLARVDVPQPCDPSLVEQKRLDLPAAGRARGYPATRR